MLLAGVLFVKPVPACRWLLPPVRFQDRVIHSSVPVRLPGPTRLAVDVTDARNAFSSWSK
jgi:hypothetical protein